MKENQESLFDNPPAWTEQWEGMPEFNQKNELPYDAINVQFKNAEDRRQFLLFLKGSDTQISVFIVSPTPAVAYSIIN